MTSPTIGEEPNDDHEEEQPKAIKNLEVAKKALMERTNATHLRKQHKAKASGDPQETARERLEERLRGTATKR